jgi:hypothetical protein
MTLTQQPSNLPAAMRLGWSLTLAALTAFAGFFITSEMFLGMPVLALLLILSQLVDWRLPVNRSIALGLRAVVFTLFLILIGYPDEPVYGWYLKSAYTNLLGAILAAELVMRAWELQNSQRRSEYLGTALLLSGLVMAAGCNTTDDAYAPVLVPIYLVLVLISLRHFVPPQRVRPSLRIMRVGVAVGAMALGLFTINTARKLSRQLEMLTADWFRRHLRISDIGLSAAPRLSGVFNPEPSMDRVLVIEGPRQERHLRVAAFDTLTRNQEWSPSLRDNERGFQHASSGMLNAPAVAEGAGGQRLKVRLLGDTFECLPAPINTAAVDAPVPLRMDRSGTLRFEDAMPDPHYQLMVSRDEHHQGPLAAAPDPAQRARALNIPDWIDPRVAAMARSAAGEGTPLIRAMRIMQKLQADHRYSLSYQPAGDDPLSDFILNGRAAHCMYFASAMVMMARAADIPSRMVTGYYAHEPGGEGETIVRDRDAHAWAELWIDGIGWLTFDATPAGGRPDALFPPPSSLRRSWERVVDLPATLRRWLSQLSQQAVITTLLATAGCVLGVGVYRMLRSRGRKRRDAAPYALPAETLQRAAKRFEKWQQRRGTPIDASQTWREHVTSLHQPAECVMFVDAYQQARFGGDSEAMAGLHRLLDRLEQSTAQAPREASHG